MHVKRDIIFGPRVYICAFLLIIEDPRSTVPRETLSLSVRSLWPCDHSWFRARASSVLYARVDFNILYDTLFHLDWKRENALIIQNSTFGPHLPSITRSIHTALLHHASCVCTHAATVYSSQQGFGDKSVCAQSKITLPVRFFIIDQKKTTYEYYS